MALLGYLAAGLTAGGWIGAHAAVKGGERLIRARHGEFIRSSLIEHDRIWPQVTIEGFSEAALPSFWFDGKEWHHAVPGDTVFPSPFELALADSVAAGEMTQADADAAAAASG